MERSQYLAQALQQMEQSQAAPQGAALSVSPDALAEMADKAKTWKAANPGQSYLSHNLQSAGANLMGAPGRAADGLKNLASLFQK